MIDNQKSWGDDHGSEYKSQHGSINHKFPQWPPPDQSAAPPNNHNSGLPPDRAHSRGTTKVKLPSDQPQPWQPPPGQPPPSQQQEIPASQGRQTRRAARLPTSGPPGPSRTGTGACRFSAGPTGTWSSGFAGTSSTYPPPDNHLI